MKEDIKPFRILHIGNVANYAYNIGKILQAEGIENHVISWDYYHINAHPVWEEGVFDASSVGDHFFPKLPGPTLTRFAEPEWFVQGPRILACLWLIAQNEKKFRRAKFFRRLLRKNGEQIHDPKYRARMAAGRQRLIEVICTDLLGGFGNPETVSLAMRRLPSGVVKVPSSRIDALRWTLLNRIDALRWTLLNRIDALRWTLLNRIDALRSVALRVGATLPQPVKQNLKKAIGWKTFVFAPKSPNLVPTLPLHSSSGKPADIKAAAASLGNECGETKTSSADVLLTPALPTIGSLPSNVESLQPTVESPRPTRFEAHVQGLIKQYEQIYPERDFDPMLLRQYEHTLPLMRRLFSHYDLIIGYAIEGIWPLMAGAPYVAYEFGTIRNIPFSDTPMGRLAAITYLNAEQTVVTNSDNEAPAKRLGRPFFFLPHVVNEGGLLTPQEAEAARGEFIAEYGGDFIVFHPSRQHWDEARDTNWDKGNDHLWRGFARLVQNNAPDARCIAVAWGEQLARSEALIEELGITANVVWINPQPHIAMMRYICLCDVVCDQFTIPTFGGIPPKAFHAGKPVVTSFDPSLHYWCFDELPPLIAANSAQLIYRALAQLHADRDFASDMGRKGADWYRRENSNARVREVLLANLEGLQRTKLDPVTRS
jgi:glycosyltransferase involved in cell wall biosynthesis